MIFCVIKIKYKIKFGVQEDRPSDYLFWLSLLLNFQMETKDRMDTSAALSPMLGSSIGPQTSKRSKTVA